MVCRVSVSGLGPVKMPQPKATLSSENLTNSAALACCTTRRLHCIWAGILLLHTQFPREIYTNWSNYKFPSISSTGSRTNFPLCLTQRSELARIHVRCYRKSKNSSVLVEILYIKNVNLLKCGPQHTLGQFGEVLVRCQINLQWLNLLDGWVRVQIDNHSHHCRSEAS